MIGLDVSVTSFLHLVWTISKTIHHYGNLFDYLHEISHYLHRKLGKLDYIRNWRIINEKHNIKGIIHRHDTGRIEWMCNYPTN